MFEKHFYSSFVLNLKEKCEKRLQYHKIIDY